MNTGVKVLLAVLVLALAFDLTLIVHQSNRSNPNGQAVAEETSAGRSDTPASSGANASIVSADSNTGIRFMPNLSQEPTEEEMEQMALSEETSDLVYPDDGNMAED
jgi:hypothetical protein